MPSINWTEVKANKLLAIKTVFISTYRTVAVLFSRLFEKHHLSIRNEIARAWLGTAFGLVPTSLYSEPDGHNLQLHKRRGFEAYTVPQSSAADLRNADAVVLFTHGGGMIMGHPLQYLSDYKRWLSHASFSGKKVVFVAPKYPLSTQAKWPAQRDAVTATYDWLLAKGVQPGRVAFAGDSAGGNLAVLSLLHLRDTKRQLPACAVLMSPWLDMSAAETLGTPLIRSDFMFSYDAGVPIMNEMLRPTGTRPDTPDISALLWKDVSRLPPQLVFYSSTEMLGSDSERWIRRCRAVGDDVTVYERRGEMHTFAVGWPACGRTTQDECDRVFLTFISKHVVAR